MIKPKPCDHRTGPTYLARERMLKALNNHTPTLKNHGARIIRAHGTLQHTPTQPFGSILRLLGPSGQLQWSLHYGHYGKRLATHHDVTVSTVLLPFAESHSGSCGPGPLGFWIIAASWTVRVHQHSFALSPALANTLAHKWKHTPAHTEGSHNLITNVSSMTDAYRDVHVVMATVVVGDTRRRAADDIGRRTATTVECLHYSPL